jgi:hypothetical protein
MTHGFVRHIFFSSRVGGWPTTFRSAPPLPSPYVLNRFGKHGFYQEPQPFSAGSQFCESEHWASTSLTVCAICTNVF